METKQKTIRDYITEKGITAITKHLGKVADVSTWSAGHHEYSVELWLTPPGVKATSIRTSWTCNPMAHLGPKGVADALPTHARQRNRARRPEPLTYKNTGRITIEQDEFNKVCEAHVPQAYQADPADVLDSLLCDASGTDQPFEDWANDCGYDTDSRKAESIFHACRESAAKLRQWLGAAELERLQNEYERL